MAEEFLIWQGAMGSYLRRARLEAGLSLREIEKQAGVARSEIQRLEAGTQDFRLISFLRLCAALGLPPSSLLDQAISCSGAYYRDRVKLDAHFSRELTARNISEGSKQERSFALFVGSLAAAAAQLLRCSAPPVIAAHAKYPNPEMQSAFIAFAQKIYFEMAPLDRLSLINGVRNSPIETLRVLGLLNERYISDSLSILKRRSGACAPIFALMPDIVPR